jgi:hypothetical protein
MTGLYVVAGILIISFLLLALAWLSSKAGQYKLRSPFQRVQPNKKRKVTKKKRKLPVVQITFNKR